jgi:hypothetical protein
MVSNHAARINATLHVFHAAWDVESEAAALEQAADILGERPYRLEIRDLSSQAPPPAGAIAAFCAQIGGFSTALLMRRPIGPWGVNEAVPKFADH